MRPTIRTLDNPVWRQKRDIKSLMRDSSLVVVGTTTRNTCKLSSDGQTVTTDYTLKVQEVIQGNARVGDDIVVYLPGGVAKNRDGTILEVRTPFFRKLKNNVTYALFLSRNDADGYVPTSGPQGLFELPSDGTSIKHLGRDFTLPPDDASGLDVEPFLNALRRLAR